MSSFSATIANITSSEHFPKTASDWVVPAAAVVALAAGASLVLKGNKHEKKPPTVPSLIPWVGSEWAIERDPDAFFDAAKKKYGDIFCVKAAGTKYYYVTSMPLINQIHRQPKLFHIAVPQMSWQTQIFTSTEAGLKEMMGELGKIFHSNYMPANIHGFVDAFNIELQREIKNLTLPTGSESLQDWVLKLAYLATGRALFGPTLDIMSTWDDWQEFDGMVWKVALGYPAGLLRDFVRGRAGLLKTFTEYLRKPQQPLEMIQQRIQACYNGGLDEHDLAVTMLCSWWPLMANVPLGTLWLLILNLQRPEGVKPLITELDQAGAAWESSNPNVKGPYTDNLPEFFRASPPTPLLSSTLSETLRFCSDSYSMRGVIVDSAELGGYTFTRGETLICRTRSIHYSEDEFENAREYIPTRFMSEDGGKGTEGNYKWMPFGGGISMCSGRHFAAFHQRILITTIIKHFRFEIDKAKSTPIVQSRINRGFGLRRPSGELFVKITRA